MLSAQECTSSWNTLTALVHVIGSVIGSGCGLQLNSKLPSSLSQPPSVSGSLVRHIQHLENLQWQPSGGVLHRWLHSKSQVCQNLKFADDITVRIRFCHQGLLDCVYFPGESANGASEGLILRGNPRGHRTQRVLKHGR